MRIYIHLAALALGTFAAAMAPAQELAFITPGQLPAAKSSLAARGPLLGVAVAGTRIVAVGQRGHIVISEDGGRSWTQSDVPLSHDLVAVSFTTEKSGWAVGHGGVLINTEDGGRTWRKRLDGREASQLAVAHFEKRVADGHAGAQAWLDKERKLASYPGTQPLMDVFFENPSVGWVVGTFNRIFETRDGGATWTPLMDQTDNHDELHFYSVRVGPSGLVITGEQGKVWVRESASGRFQIRPTPFGGTLFGSVQSPDGALVVFGMVGAAFHSRDRGVTWQRVETGSPAGLTAGTLVNGRLIVLVSVAGQILVSTDGGVSFRSRPVERPISYTAAVALPDSQSVALASAEGVRIVKLAP